jgi:ribosomal protein S18 acetylase RimI-like enzyme
MMSQSYSIRKAELSDALEMAKIHKSSLAVDMLSQLNNDDLIVKYYKYFIGKIDFYVLELDTHELVSFVGITTREFDYEEELKKFCKMYIMDILASCIKSIKAFRMILRKVLSPSNGAIQLNAGKRVIIPFEIHITVTKPQYQSMGCGKLCLNHAVEQLGITSCIVKTHSRRAARFYEKCGFKKTNAAFDGNWNLIVLSYYGGVVI